MKFLALVPAAALVIFSAAHAAEVPKVFAGLFEKDVPTRAQIGVVVPPPGIDKYVSKVEIAARQDPKWFREYTVQAKPGAPLPFNEKLGLTKAEYDEYLKLWNQREFKAVGEDVMLLLRENGGSSWSVTGTGAASTLSTLRYSAKDDTFQSPNGTLVRGEEIKADPESILGAWSGTEWKFEEETSLGKTKENIAFGKFADNKYGIIVYRVVEVSSEGTKLIDKSLVIRFALGKAGQLKPATATAPAAGGAPATTPATKPAPAPKSTPAPKPKK
jgi:hypothetical protein